MISAWQILAFTAEDRWEPGIGDPTVGGWLTVVAYFAASALCWRAVKASGPFRGKRIFWSLYTAGLLFLGLNKQLDLQTWLTLFAKRLALGEGWYDYRQIVQVLFIGAVAVAGATGLWLMRRLAGRITRAEVIALAGGTFLLCFVLIRASSFHHVDQLIGFRLAGLKVNWIIELGSIVCIAFGAHHAARTTSHSQCVVGPDFVWIPARPSDGSGSELPKGQ